MRQYALAIAAGISLAASPAFAEEPTLDPALQRLLEAAATSPSQDDFADAVRLLALTAPTPAILSAAEGVGRQAEARTVLDLPAPAAQPSPDALAAVRAARGVPEPDEASGSAHWRAAPLALASAIYNAQSDLWDGRVKFGMRLDSGNSQRQDFAGAIEVERALRGWGFEGAIEYVYSEVDGTVGRDELLASARGERELGERFTAYSAGEYEQDALEGYNWTGFIGGGLGYRVVETEQTSFVLRAGPGVRFLDDIEGPLQTRFALDLGADLSVPITETVTFGSETGFLAASRSRADQRFTLSSALGDLWAIELNLHYRYEFEPEPGFETTDTRTDVSIVREF